MSEQLQRLKQQGLYRSRKVVETAQATQVIVDGQPLINFCSNDYLGLANHSLIIKAMHQAIDQFGVGSGSAHLICGHSTAHHALEEELADFTGRQRALLFSTGYMANLGVLAGLMGHSGFVLQDRLNHASLLDGALLSRADLKRYRHLDCQHLQTLLADNTRPCMIASDGVFSMDGDLAPLQEISHIAKQFDALLLVDDAHGIGVLGKDGAGILSHLQLSEDDVPLLMGTLGKAFGVFGAFVAGSDDLIETLIQKARTYMFTTAMPPALAEASRASLRVIQQEPWRRDKLQSLIHYFRNAAKQLSLPLMDSQTAIQPLLIGEAKAALTCSEILQQHGFWIQAIRPPTVPQGQSRLRITISSEHKFEQLDALLDALSKSL